MKKLYISVLLLVFSACFAIAGNLHGTVIDAGTGKPLAGATVRLEGTAFGAITDNAGHFEIKAKVPPGKYSLLVSMVGYQANSSELAVGSGEQPEIKVKIKEQPLQMGEVVVSANKRVQAVQEVPVSVSIVDSRILQSRNITKVEEALAYVPGVTVKKGNIDIRGTSGFALGVGSRVSLLLDGFPMLSADNGDMKFDALPLFDIERIEVVKGAGSALYGTGALGGVVNVITRPPSDVGELKIRAFGGAYTKPRYRQWHYSDNLHMNKGAEASYSKKLGNLGMIVSAGFTDDESFRVYDDSFRWHVFGKAKYDAGDNTEFTFLAHRASEDKADWLYWHSLDSATFPDNDVDRSNRFRSDKLALFADMKHIIDPENFLIVRTGLFGTDFESSLEPTDPDYRQSTANSYHLELQMNSRLGVDWIFTYGSNIDFNEVEAKTYGIHDQSIYALYGQMESKALENLTFTGGLRLDYEKTTDLEENFEISPKFGFLYETPIDLNLRASFGKGFRAPNVVERYASITYAGFSVIPAPGLKPERSWSYEVGANFGFDFLDLPVQIDASVFWNDLYDLIEPQLLVDNVQFQNVTRARIRGAELSLKGFLFFLGLESSLTYMDPRNLDTDAMLKYRSTWLWYNRMILPLDYLEFQMDYRYLSEMEEVDRTLYLAGVKDVDARVPIHVVDARMIFHLHRISSYPFSISLNVKNLFDYYYTEVVGNLGPTRFLSVQIDAKF